jgi:hypothetical protein
MPLRDTFSADVFGFSENVEIKLIAETKLLQHTTTGNNR